MNWRESVYGSTHELDLKIFSFCWCVSKSLEVRPMRSFNKSNDQHEWLRRVHNQLLQFRQQSLSLPKFNIDFHISVLIKSTYDDVTVCTRVHCEQPSS